MHFEFLKGIQVLDLSTHYPGPFCSRLLSDLGAKVTRITHPSKKDPVASFGESYQEYLNHGKAAIPLDLKKESDYKEFVALLREADVLLQGFRPKTMKSLNIEPETVFKANPKVIYCALSGYRLGHPKENDPAHDQNFLALSGVLSLLDPPSLPPIPLGDVFAAWHAAFLIASALYARDVGGSDSIFLNPTIFDSIDLAQGTFRQEYQSEKKLVWKGEHFFSGALPHYQIYKTKDDHFLSVAPLEQHYLELFLNTLGLESLLEKLEKEPNYFKQEIQKRLLEKTQKEWMELFKKSPCCVEPVINWKEREELGF